MEREFLKYHFIPEFDGILQYFFYLHGNIFPTETSNVVFVSEVKSYKHKNFLLGSLTSDSNTLKSCILKPYGSLVI